MSPIFLLKEKIKISNESQKGLITFLNPYSYLFFRKNISLFEKIDQINIDGILLVYLLKLFGINSARKSFDMTSLAPIVFKNSIENNEKVFIIGSTEKSIRAFVEIIKDSFPKLNVIGIRNGYFKSEFERTKSIISIIKLNPELVIVGMGTPYQEQFLIDLRNGGWDGVGYTCGGFIHQSSKGIKYYPVFYDRFNLRWLYRILDEPKLLKRYFVYYPKSIILLCYDFIRYWFSKNYSP